MGEEDESFSAIVENHAVANVDVLFHAVEEECTSSHTHKVGISSKQNEKGLKHLFKEMLALSQTLPT